MKKLAIELEHCYGIKKLKHTFDFNKSSVFSIYAPNGAMKSSLAETFEDLVASRDSRDRVFPARATIRNITDESGAAVPSDQVLVIRPYQEDFSHSEEISSLLVNAELQKEYTQLQNEVEEAKDALLRQLRSLSGAKRDVEEELSRTFTGDTSRFYEALAVVKPEIEAQEGAPFASTPYEVVFDEKVLAFLRNDEVRGAIAAYIDAYGAAVANSRYFKRHSFNYYDASTVAKSLGDHGFFDAKHFLILYSDAAPLEVKDRRQLEALIAEERKAIADDPKLRTTYGNIEKLITKNVTLRDFEKYISEHEDVLSSLIDPDEFRRTVWKSYLKASQDLLRRALTRHTETLDRRRAIESEAADQRTRWQEVVEIFNDRFAVPFRLGASNRVSVILGQEPTLKLSFSFQDGQESAALGKEELLDVLSTGEKKALYILNVIFEIQTRRHLGRPTLLVVDDVADSFDYKNKYAIVQYLSDIAEDDTFKMIVLTHNFDFFRTIESRFVNYSACLMASKTAAGLSLEKASGIRNIFSKDWKGGFWTDGLKRVACIPFMRNLIEFTKGPAELAYSQLTALLHWQPISDGITESELDGIYVDLFGGTAPPRPKDGRVVDLILKEADGCLEQPEGINLANKVVLSMAIRLLADRFMIKVLPGIDLTKEFGSNQTPKLLKALRKKLGEDHGAVPTLARVVLMTPENIHLNSFMYEPILDMSDEHLRKLYRDVKALK